jgi:hypothetical protein
MSDLPMPDFFCYYLPQLLMYFRKLMILRLVGHNTNKGDNATGHTQVERIKQAAETKQP